MASKKKRKKKIKEDEDIFDTEEDTVEEEPEPEEEPEEDEEEDEPQPKKKKRRGRPPLSDEEKARRAKLRAEGKLGTPGRKPGRPRKNAVATSSVPEDAKLIAARALLKTLTDMLS